MSKEAMKLALEALEQIDGINTETECVTIDVGNVITALEEALAEQPAQRTWVGLTDEEQIQVAWSCGAMAADWLEFAQAIEAKLMEKNT
ncbi:MAG TPA: hypothetical protein VLA24_14635 [Pseudomonadales bacterium]|nr:hypothetical protein [Pseudomonadales bacterium]